MALHALRHFSCSAQQAADNGAPCNTGSEAALAVALQDFLFWLTSYRCHTCPQWGAPTHAQSLLACGANLPGMRCGLCIVPPQQHTLPCSLAWPSRCPGLMLIFTLHAVRPDWAESVRNINVLFLDLYAQAGGSFRVKV